MPLNVGEKLGPYEILASIGAGGMGDVYKARDTRLDRMVAIKVSREQFSERFGREARAIAALNHPNICQLYDVGPNYLVMECVEGNQLRGPLALEKVGEYAGQILEALDAAHKKGIIHRDLKPANILITKQGVKLLDFGLAKLTQTPLKETDATVTSALTGQGQILGTMQYMSPEQLQGKEVDARSDLFAFGCVLYEMLTGKRAFEGSSSASVIAAILEREPAPLQTPSSLERVLKRALAKDPDQRFQTARDLKAALGWTLEQPLAAPSSRRPRPWMPTAAFGFGCLLIGALGIWTIVHFRQNTNDRALRLYINPPAGGRFVFGNNIGGIALSPDGKNAAFVASVNGTTALWVHPLEGDAPHLIGGTAGAAYPFWSPDSKSIGFFAQDGLRRVDLEGGAPLTICQTRVPRGGAWTSEGQIVFGTLATGLFQVSASGGTPSVLTTQDSAHGEISHRWPQILPGGRFLYFSANQKPESTGIYSAPLSKPADRVQVLSTDANALYARGGDGKDYLLWLRGGTLVAQEFDIASSKLTGQLNPVADPVSKFGASYSINVSASANGLVLYSASNPSVQFTWLDATGKLLRSVGDPGEFSSFRLSPDGHRIVASRDKPGATDLWILEQERGISSPLTFHSASTIFPIWSPDGRTIVFRFGSKIFRKDFRGGDEHQMQENKNLPNPTDWSSDGHFILEFESDPVTQRDLTVVPMTPGGEPDQSAKPEPYLRTQSNESWGRFSPEPSPHWVVYQSDESGRSEIYIQSFPKPRGATRISTGGGRYPTWGAGGHDVFYLSPEDKLMRVTLKVGAESVEPSSPHELFQLRFVDDGFSPYDVSADGRFIVRAVPEQAPPPLAVIVNWQALLKKGSQ